MHQTSWLTGREVLKEGRDFCWADHDKAQAINGSKPLMIYWAWYPMHDDPEMGEKLLTAWVDDESLTDNTIHRLLVVHADDYPVEAFFCDHLFTGIALLSKHVVAGAWGPYPSIRAERSIFRTWSQGLVGIRHYWPSVLLDRKWYHPLDLDKNLLSMWSQYHRKNLSLSTPEGE
jgi:hypothetical protein